MESDICWRVPIATIKERGYDLDIKNPNRAEDTREHSSAELIEMLQASIGKSSKLLGMLKKLP